MAPHPKSPFLQLGLGRGDIQCNDYTSLPDLFTMVAEACCVENIQMS